jgi:hypothetical protein
MVTEAAMDISSERLVCGALRHTRAAAEPHVRHKHGEIRVYAECKRHLHSCTATRPCLSLLASRTLRMCNAYCLAPIAGCRSIAGYDA